MTSEQRLTDAAIRGALSTDPFASPPAGLVDAIAVEVAGTRQARGAIARRLAPPDTRGWAGDARRRWIQLVALAALLAAAAISAALIAGQLVEPRPPNNGSVVVAFGGDLHEYSARGDDLRSIVTGADDIAGLTWSPDGRWLAWWALRGTAWTLEVAAATDLTGVAIGHGQMFAPRTERISWAPDGHALAFDESGAGRAGVLIWDRATDQISELAPGTTGDSPAWSPTGARIAFRSAGAGSADSRIVVADPQNGRLETIVAGLADGFAPLGGERSLDWSSDGNRLVFDAVRTPREFRSFLVGADGSGLTQLGANLNAFAPDLSPDGRFVSVLHWHAGVTRTSGVYVLTLDSAAAPVLIAENANVAGWASDSSEVLVGMFAEPLSALSYCTASVRAVTVDGRHQRLVADAPQLRGPEHAPCTATAIGWQPRH